MKSVFAPVAALLLVSACASTKTPPPEPAPAQQPAPAPAPAPPPPSSSALQPLPPAPGSVEEFVKAVGDRVYFDYNEARLTHQTRAVLSKQAAWLNRYPNVRILIDGNCDERGTREYNLALGARRASAARDYLVSLGVAPGRISTISYGKERPIDPRSNEEAWAKNRNAHSGIVSGAVS